MKLRQAASDYMWAMSELTAEKLQHDPQWVATNAKSSKEHAVTLVYRDMAGIPDSERADWFVICSEGVIQRYATDGAIRWLAHMLDSAEEHCYLRYLANFAAYADDPSPPYTLEQLRDNPDLDAGEFWNTNIADDLDTHWS